MRTTRRLAGFTVVVAVVAALLAPAVSAQAAPTPQITGSTGDSWQVWLDRTLDATMTVGVPYSSSVQGPSGGNYNGLHVDGLPAGLTATLNDVNGVITVSGTPTEAADDVSFTLSYQPDSEQTYTIEFSGFTVLPDTIATVTTVQTDSYSPYTALNLRANVSSSTSGGTVDFYLDSTKVGTVAVTAVGTAEFTGSVDPSFIGTSPVVKAVFSGTSTYGPSNSVSVSTVYVYGDRVISGYFIRNGVGTNGEHIHLLTSAAGTTLYTDVTSAGGYFEIALNPPTSLSSAMATYVIHALDSDFYYSSSTALGDESPFGFAAATATGDAQWEGLLNIYDFRDPIWTDETLAQPRMGEAYSDGVTADPLGSGVITYSATGDVPSWLTLSPTTGAFTSTGPTDQTAHTFTVRATSDFGYIEKQFTLQAGDAAVPPTFTDTDIVDHQVGTAVTDAIAATGDATIVYSSTPLPPGLSLNSATGAITGTPTTAGDYVVTFTASNGVNPDATFVWEPTITAAPEIELELNFSVGATIETATTDIGAGGLKVGSTYTLTMFSTPRILYTGTVDATGAFLHTITLPADTPVGAHELELVGIAPDGTVMTARAWFTLLPNGTIGAISYAGPLSFTLAATGSELFAPLGLAAGLMVAGYLLVLRRRRSAIA
jgi:hypothetical protein